MIAIRSIFLIATMVVSIACIAQGRWGSIWGGVAFHQYDQRYDGTAAPVAGLRYGHDLGNTIRINLGLEYEWVRTREGSVVHTPYPAVLTMEIESQNVNLQILGAIRLRSTEYHEWRLMVGGVSRVLVLARYSERHPGLMHLPPVERTLTGSNVGSSLRLQTGVRYARKLTGRTYGFAEAWAGRTLLITGDEYYSFGMGQGGVHIPIPVYSFGINIGFEFGPELLPLKKVHQ